MDTLSTITEMAIGSLENIFKSISFKKYVLPSAIMIALTLVVLYNITPSISICGYCLNNWVDSLLKFSPWPVIVFILCVILLTLLISSQVQYIVMIFEGYWGSSGLWGIKKRLKASQYKRVDSIEKKISEKKEKYRQLKKQDNKNGNQQDIQNLLKDIDELFARRLSYYPPNKYEIMPTLLGNIISSAESYARDRYNVESISVWLRMQDAISATYKQLLNIHRDQLDLFIVMSFIYYIFALECLIVCLISLSPKIMLNNSTCFLIAGFIAFIIARLFYKGAIGHAVPYADAVKCCFDLFRKQTLKNLGIECPKTLKKERELWGELSDFITYGREFAEIGGPESKVKYL